jgi:hypothetical protein
MDEMRCEAGCKSFTGGERQHRRDCAFYPESLTKIWHDTEDNLTAEIARLKGIADAAENMLISYGMGSDMDGTARVLMDRLGHPAPDAPA